MNPHLQRALLLFEQGRHELAEQELRQALGAEPHDPYAHALLALCLAHREKLQEATESAQQAIHLAPDFPFAHYALASILHDRHRPEEALAAVEEALRFEPENPGFCALLAQIRLDRRDWAGALEAAERGLQFAPDHIGCTNLRAIALVKLGRRAEAGATIDAALARDPDNAITHANQGWTCLEQADPAKALEHFREALRLDPTNEWAQAGIVEALKARNILYGLMLRYFLWMSRLPSGVQWGVILGGYFLNRLMSAAAETSPALAPILLPFRILYFTAVLLTWTADPLFNLFLRVNRFGRLALSEEQRTASTWFGLTLLLALVSLGLCFAFGFKSVFLLCAMVFGFLMVPVAGMFKASRGWPRTLLMSYTGGLAVAGMTLLVAAAVGNWRAPLESKALGTVGTIAFGAFLIGSMGFMWGANFIIPIQPKR